MQLIGIERVERDPRQVVHLFGSALHPTAFGVVYWHEARWRVRGFGEHVASGWSARDLAAQAEGARTSRAPVLGDAVAFFRSQARPFARATSRQIDLLARLGLVAPPAGLERIAASRLIDELVSIHERIEQMTPDPEVAAVGLGAADAQARSSADATLRALLSGNHLASTPAHFEHSLRTLGASLAHC